MLIFVLLIVLSDTPVSRSPFDRLKDGGEKCRISCHTTLSIVHNTFYLLVSNLITFAIVFVIYLIFAMITACAMRRISSNFKEQENRDASFL